MGRRYGYMCRHLKKHFKPRKSFHQLAETLQKTLEEALPSMVGDRVNEIAKKIVPLYVAEGLLLDKQKTQADVAAMIAETMLKKHENLRAEITLKVNNAITNNLQYQLYLMMKNDEKLCNDDLSIWWSLKIKFDKPATCAAPCRTTAIHPRDHEDHHDDAHPKGENSAKRHKTSEHGTFSVGPKKYTLSLHKFPAIPFPKDDIKEGTSRWVNKQGFGKVEEVQKDVKYGYANPSPNDADAEYLRFYEDDIEERLKHCDQMRRWEIYVNGRPLGSRRDP
ncbi:hypothetical protein Tco_0625979 [Tanacetum coccineum]|uniref:Uncharacterized protein n=1 Tax=Tanacetum coccineum TaxID=301880 RepID=A0ABQ4WIE3_9ASTR